MNSYKGTRGNDNLTGTKHKDHFDLSQGGNDKVDGLDGDDVFYFGHAFNAADTVVGGAGVDVLELNGLRSPVNLRVHSLSSVEQILFDAGSSYRLHLNDADVTRGLSLNASKLGPGDSLQFNGAAETDGRLNFVGGAGNDKLTGGDQNDRFNLAAGGNDIVNGGDGRDIFVFRSALTSKDQVQGGSFSDHVVIDGDYSDTLVLHEGHMDSVAIFAMRTGHDYNIKARDGAFGTTPALVNIVSYTFGADDNLTFNGSAESLVRYRFFTNDGTYNLKGGAGNDTFIFGSHFNSADVLNGGGGTDILALNGEFQHPEMDGNYTGTHALVFGAHQLQSVETIGVVGGFSYDITTVDENVAAGQTLTILAAGFKTTGSGALNGKLAGLSTTDSLTFDGSAESDGHFVFYSGAGSDTLTGGSLEDTFVYAPALSISGATRDTINAFDFSNDVVKFAHVTGIDTPVISGGASNASIDTDITAQFGAGSDHELGANHAVLFTADSGDLSGNAFLIVDGNGVAGYQAGSDLLIELHGALNTAAMSTANFSG